MRQTNTRKKNNLRSMIIVALLLLLVAVIGFGGYTLSKYVSNKTEGGQAQVAKWGYTVEADATNLFGKNYKFDNGKSNSIIASAGDTALTVSASTATENNLVAPGTTGSMTFSVKGTAEVKAQLDINFAFEKNIVLAYTQKDVTGTKTYEPIKWTLTKNSVDVVTKGTIEEVKNALNSSNTYAPNAPALTDEYTLSWVWDFGAATVSENDHLDTILGMLANGTAATDAVSGDYAAATTGTTTELKFTLKISVTQLAQ